MEKTSNEVETRNSKIMTQLINEQYWATKHISIPASDLYLAIQEYGKKVNNIYFSDLYYHLRKKFEIISFNRMNLKRFIRKYFVIKGEVVNVSKSPILQGNNIKDIKSDIDIEEYIKDIKSDIDIEEYIKDRETFHINIVRRIYDLIIFYGIETLDYVFSYNYYYFLNCLRMISLVKNSNHQIIIPHSYLESLFRIIYKYLKLETSNERTIDDNSLERWWDLNREKVIGETKLNYQYIEIKTLTNKIPISNYQYNLLLLSTESLQEIFKKNNFKYVMDIVNNFSFDFFSNYYIYYDDLYSLCDFLTNNLDEEIIKKHNMLTCLMSERELQVLILRSKGTTLEFIGSSLSLTRERVRQIELKAFLKLKHKFNSMAENGKYGLINLIQAKAKYFYYIDNDEVKSLIKNEIYLLPFIFDKIKISNVVYIKELDCFDCSNTNWYKRSIEYFHNLPSKIESQEINEYLLVFLDEISINQEEPFPINKLKNAFYTIYIDYGEIASRNKLTLADKFGFIIKKHFKDGIYIYDDKDIDKFKYFYLKSFGKEINLKSNRSLIGVITRFTNLVDRGKYNLSENIPRINIKLLRQIIDYIRSTGESALYSTIFFNFEDELKELNIHNKYLLQSALRKETGESYYYYRDYISLNKQANYSDELREYLLNYEGIISANDLLKSFSHINENIIYNILNSTKELVSLFNKEWIHIKNFKVEQSDLDYLHNYLSMKTFDNGIVTSQVLYDGLVVNYSDFLRKNNINSQYTLYSILQNYFSEEFNFKRPFISQLNFEIKNKKEYILDFIYDNDIIYFYEIREFCFENSLQIYNMNELLKSINNEYLRIDKDRIARINMIGLDDLKIKQFKYIINNMLLMNKSFKLNRFKKYDILPELNFEWNVYILASLVEKYVDSGNILYTTPNYTNTEYIIIEKNLNIKTYEEYLEYKRG